ncbi:MAG: glycosyltransferase [Treponemataceae bacterium]|nr:glycosyltransferase [Treponemataceae bacterium]
MNNNKVILHISNYYPPNKGGIEQVAYDLVSGLKDQYENIVICFNHDTETKKEIYEDIPIYRIGYKIKLFSQAISFKYLFILKKIIKEYNPKILYLHLPNPLITIYLLLCNIKNKKIVVHWHSDIIDQKLLKIFYKPFQDIILKKANIIFTTSKEYKDNSNDLKKYLYKVDVVPNVVNTKRFLFTKNDEIKSAEIKKSLNYKKILLFIGRHVPYKGLEYLIKASDLINEDAVIIIAGDGPLTSRLREQSKNKQNIIFVGRLSEEELKAYMLCAYLFLFPSITKNEAFGLALAEALYCGIPAIGFNIPGSGVNWVNKNGYTGFMVENRNYYELAQKINYLLENIEIRNKMSLNAKSWIKENFMYENMISIVKNVLKQL